MRCFLVLSVLLFVAASAAISIHDAYASCADMQFKSLEDGLNDTIIKRVSIDPWDAGRLYAASSDSVYTSTDGGQSWKIVFSLKSDGGAINAVYPSVIQKDRIYVATDNGLYRRGGSIGWERIFRGIGSRENSVLSIIEISEAGSLVFAGTRSGLFNSGDGGRSWNKVPGLPSDIEARKLVNRDKVLYALTDRGLFRGENHGLSWVNIYKISSSREVELYDSDDERLAEDYEPERGRELTSLVSGPDNRLYLGTTDGLLISSDGGRNWQSGAFEGITGLDVRALAASDGASFTIYAATADGPYCLDPETGTSEELYKGLLSGNVFDVSILSRHEGSVPQVVAATAKGLFASSSAGDAFSGIYDADPESVLAMFSDEPTIVQIRESAIRYAEVHPEKIRKWRRAAAARAWLPDLHFSYDKGHDWQSSTYFYSTSTQKYKDDDITKGRDYGWSVSLTWELGDLIWNNDQTSIDSRSRLMVQMRDDIVNEVTRLYYERRRLQVKMLLSPASGQMKRIDDELRLQELTASIDALTGSYMSRLKTVR